MKHVTYNISKKTDRPFPSCVISGKLDTLYLLMHITYYNIL